jgi:hypothetical protein
MRTLAIAAAALLVSTAAVAQTPITDLTGRTMTLIDAQGGTSTVSYEADNVVRVSGGDMESEGRWEIANDQLCFEFEGEERECWPWDGGFPTGQAVPVASPSGQAYIITLN